LHCGVGGKIILCDGSQINWTLNCGLRTNTKDELLGAWVSLYLASHHNILNLHVRGDSKIIINWLNGKGMLRVEALECWKDRINELTQTFTQINFSHLYRELNQEVDFLSKKSLLDLPSILSYQLWIGGLERSNHCIPLF
jgi:ribonuclease HI